MMHGISSRTDTRFGVAELSILATMRARLPAVVRHFDILAAQETMERSMRIKG